MIIFSQFMLTREEGIYEAMNKTVLITGTSRGFGYALAGEFLLMGWTVYGVVRNGTDARRMTEQDSLQCIPIISDVASDRIQTDILNAIPPSRALDVVINNAGIGTSGSTLGTASSADISDLLQVHCVGAFRVIQAVMPFLKDDATIINVSSRFGSISKVASAISSMIGPVTI